MPRHPSSAPDWQPGDVLVVENDGHGTGPWCGIARGGLDVDIDLDATRRLLADRGLPNPWPSDRKFLPVRLARKIADNP